MIKFGTSCTELISNFAVEANSIIALPLDICLSVVQLFKLLKLPFTFYPVHRNWSEVDSYELDSVKPFEIVLASDLFNFRTINLPELVDRSVVLDLAHCSLETAHYYIKQLEKYNIRVMKFFISFGRGKFYRFGGGGVSFSKLDIKKLKVISNVKYLSEGIPNYILDNGIYNDYSTRIILPSSLIDQLKIDNMRKRGFDISDSLKDHLFNRAFLEYIVWKRAVPTDI